MRQIKLLDTSLRDGEQEIAQTKMSDLNAVDMEGAMKQVEGSARSMGILVED